MSELVSGQRFGTPIITQCIRVVVHGRHTVLLGELAPTNVFGPERPNRIVQVGGHKLHVCPPQGAQLRFKSMSLSDFPRLLHFSPFGCSSFSPSAKKKLLPSQGLSRFNPDLQMTKAGLYRVPAPEICRQRRGQGLLVARSKRV